MAETQRFGLEKFGGAYGGAITDDGGKYSSVDRDTIDRLLHAFELHAHDADSTSVALADPGGAPTAVAASTGGTIPGGVTYYYKVSYIDAFGLETAASDEVSVSTGAAPLATEAPVVNGSSASGQTLPAGTYYYALTALSAQGESSLGPQAIITVQPTQNGVTLTLPAMANGITGFNVWRHGISDAGWTKVGINVSGSWTDTGVPTGSCLTDPATQPPSTIMVSVGTNSITVTVPDATLVGTLGGDVRAWRLYRSDASGNYGSSSLVAETVPADDSTPLVTSYTDTGGSLLTGGPLLVSTTLTPSRRIYDAGATLPPVTGYREQALFLDTSVPAFFALLGGAWTQLSPSVPDDDTNVGGGTGGGSVGLVAPGTSAVTIKSTINGPLYDGGWVPSLSNEYTSVERFVGHDLHLYGSGNITGIAVDTPGLYDVFVEATVGPLAPGDVVAVRLSNLSYGLGASYRQFVVGPGQTSVYINFADTVPLAPRQDGIGVNPQFDVHRASTGAAPTYQGYRFGLELVEGTPAGLPDVTKLPGQVDSLTVSANNPGSGTIYCSANPPANWTTLSNDGNGLYGYRFRAVAQVDPTDVHETFTTENGDSSAGITGLTFGRTYDVTVQALNDYGYGIPATGTATPLPPPPVTLPFADEFNAGNNTPIGSDWTQPPGVEPLLQRNGGYLSAGTTTGRNGKAYLDAGTANQDVTVVVSQTGSGGPTLELYLRVTDEDNRVLLHFEGADCTAYDVVAGSYNTITLTPGAAFTSYVNGTATLRVRLLGTALTIYEAGTVVYTGTLSAAHTGTKAGFLISATKVTLDRYAIDTAV